MLIVRSQDVAQWMSTWPSRKCNFNKSPMNLKTLFSHSSFFLYVWVFTFSSVNSEWADLNSELNPIEAELLACVQPKAPWPPGLDVCAVLSVCNPPGAACSALWSAHFLVSSALSKYQSNIGISTETMRSPMMPTPDLDNRGCHSHTIRMAQRLQNSSTYQKKFSPDWSKGLFISHHRHFVVNRGGWLGIPWHRGRGH